MKSQVALLTGGGDKPYALGMAAALTQCEIDIDFIGSDELAVPELLNNPRIRFLNLRGTQGSKVAIGSKIRRVLLYYVRLLSYTLTARPRIFHILWNNKFEAFDRTVLMVLYKVTNRKVVLTVHNVNAAERDSRDSWLNRASLKMQYRLTNHLLVHTSRMRDELKSGFRIPEEKISVIPFGINNTVPDTALSPDEARQFLKIIPNDKVLLFFGNIAPYKGLEHLVEAFFQLAKSDKTYRLIIAGRTKQDESYWIRIKERIASSGLEDRVMQKIEFIPDEETEIFFKAADVLVLPYTHVFQSGVLFLGYSFGLPAVVTDVGALRSEVIEGKTGFIAAPSDPSSLVHAVRRYFESDLRHKPDERRKEIRAYANERYSWNKVGAIIKGVYAEISKVRSPSREVEIESSVGQLR